MEEIEIDNRIAKINSELRELKETKRQLAKMKDDQRLAIELHGILCHWNHTDGCGWEYEMDEGIHQWERASHAPYLEKARKLIRFALKNKIKIPDLIKVYKMLGEM